MFDHLSLLTLYSEWGVDETLASLCTNHLDDRKSTPSIPVIKTSSVHHKSLVKHPNQPLQAKNIDELCKVITSFKEYPLHNTAMHCVLPKGNPNSRIFIIGEVPDADEDRSGQVFFGQSEFWLNQLLNSIDLSLEECFRMPIIPWRPPGGRQLSNNELATCLPFLYKALELYKPQFIFSIGILPARILTQTSAPISQLKGQWHTIHLPQTHITLQLFPLRHPSQIQASAKIRQETWNDLLHIRKTLSDTGIKFSI
ncbi:uracil-DNA glycosylase [Commensalibacter nepenthis]|uniref:Uracil-DNA glycosylase n=1 Tax=Commensalibacter nepenthis TaxID=3043872 RepID=A0ABT6Q8P6_9PROT|nr:uracil-DNA glycosylase [Commensalibacter sp. TBRC 10068]MDI2113161.1 uracil-DNA glycosylase [Commensalibacter sp. TBRC 10068]